MTKARTLADNFAADINGITAGTGITGGGTSGTVTITNDMATTITAKGDLLAGTGNATYDNLAIGNNGDTLLADSSASTGLRWQGNFAAGKNKIINGDFNINQRGFTSTTSTFGYNFDRWTFARTGGSLTLSAETFTPGTAPVAGYESKNFVRCAISGQSAAADRFIYSQAIESVRTFANQTITVSFWAKASSGTPSVAVSVVQTFGSGGSPSGDVQTAGGKIAITTSWARYSVTFAVPSISGKTIGTANDDALNVRLWTSAGTDFNAPTNSLGIQNATIDFWGVQVEAGAVATPFTTATGTLAGELAACQRYYYRINGNGSNGPWAIGYYYGTATAGAVWTLPVVMRTTPTFTPSSGTIATIYNNQSSGASTAITDNGGNNHTAFINFARTGVANTPASITFASGYLEWSSEL